MKWLGVDKEACDAAFAQFPLCNFAFLHFCTVSTVLSTLHFFTVSALHFCTVSTLHFCTFSLLHFCTFAQFPQYFALCTFAQFPLCNLHFCTVSTSTARLKFMLDEELPLCFRVSEDLYTLYSFHLS